MFIFRRIDRKCSIQRLCFFIQQWCSSMKKIVCILALLICFQQHFVESAQAQNIVSLDNPYIHYDGTFYTQPTPTLVTFDRHKPEVYNNPESGIYGAWIRQWVITQTGIRVRFKTKSPQITFTFQQRTGGGTIGSLPTGGFGVFADSVFIGSYSTLSFTINNPHAGASTFYEVSLPNLWAVDLIGMELSDTYILDDPGILNKPVYVAIGDSKTHGTGQYVSSAKTYPFLLASEMKWNLYNIAVAGATSGWAMALNVKGQQVDYITIEIGYNDWATLTDPLSTRQIQYEQLIDSLRAYLPNAKIYCISILATTSVSGTAPYTIDAYRKMIKDVVAFRQQTDSKLFLIPGPAVSDISMLASGDAVHLSEYGAAILADNLSVAINYPESIVTRDQSGSLAKNHVIIEYINTSQINIAVLNEGYYSFGILSTDGKLLSSMNEIYLKNGINAVAWSTTGFGNGLAYVVKVQQGNWVESALVVLGEK